MIETICNILGCTKRRRLAKRLNEEIEDLRQQQEKQIKYQATLGGHEEDWFKRVCVEYSTQEVPDVGHLKTPLSVHSSS